MEQRSASGAAVHERISIGVEIHPMNDSEDCFLNHQILPLGVGRFQIIPMIKV